MAYVNKGRSRGEDRWSAKLVTRDVLEIRRRHSEGDKLKDIHADYPMISKVAVHHVIHRRTWKHI